MRGMVCSIIALALTACEGSSGSQESVQGIQTAQLPLDSSTIPKFVDPLPALSVAGGTVATIMGDKPVTLSMCEFKANVLPTGSFQPGVKPETWVWGYVEGAQCPTATQDTYTGPVIVATRGTPTQVRYINQLGDTATSNLLAYTHSVDQTLHWADPLGNEANQCNMAAMMTMPDMRMGPEGICALNYAGPIPAVPHLHGGEVPSWIDGGPTAWFTSDGSKHGHTYYSAPGAAANEVIYRYPNSQEAAPIWFHDHTLGATRLNVYAGLAGAYVLTDPAQRLPHNLPGPAAIIPLVLQDRMFDTNGQLFFPAGPGFAPNPEHPFWVPEFVGDTIVVNGKAWPYLELEAKRYRFLFLEGSNARSYELFIADPANPDVPLVSMWVIGTDGGYLDRPAKIAAEQGKKLIMMPGERYDVIIDFAGVKPGTNLLLRNTAAAPYPAGDVLADPATTGQILQFRIKAPSGVDRSFDPSSRLAALRGGPHLGRELVRLADPHRGTLAVWPHKVRQLTLNEVTAEPSVVNGVSYPGGPLEILVNNTRFSGESDRGYGDFAPINTGGITTLFSELPKEGETELWELVNLTMDAHPIHLHLVQFQVVNRQDFDADLYAQAYAAAFPSQQYQPAFGPPRDYRAARNPLSGGKDGGNPDVDPYLRGRWQPPRPEEAGWKDTVMALPMQVTRIVVRWAPTGLPAWTPPFAASYPFDPAVGPGYVWHCHIVDHEDNEMMRPTHVISNRFFHFARSYRLGRDF